MNADYLIRWQDTDRRLLKLLEQASALVRIPLDWEPEGDFSVEQSEEFLATAGELREIAEAFEDALDDDLAADDRELILDVVAAVRGVLLGAELDLFTGTPAARLMHFNSESEER